MKGIQPIEIFRHQLYQIPAQHTHIVLVISQWKNTHKFEYQDLQTKYLWTKM